MGLSYQNIEQTIYLVPTELILTNELLDLDYIRHLVALMLAKELCPESIIPIFVKESDNQCYYVNDGNHRTAAARRANWNRIPAIVYRLSD